MKVTLPLLGDLKNYFGMLFRTMNNDVLTRKGYSWLKRKVTFPILGIFEKFLLDDVQDFE